MIPYLAQGANSSIEDGAVIGLLLGGITSKSQLPQALRLYQSIRKPRGEEIARESLKIVGISPILWELENETAAANVKSEGFVSDAGWSSANKTGRYP